MIFGGGVFGGLCCHDMNAQVIQVVRIVDAAGRVSWLDEQIGEGDRNGG